MNRFLEQQVSADLRSCASPSTSTVRDTVYRIKAMLEADLEQNLPLGVTSMTNVELESERTEDGSMVITARMRLMGHRLTGLQAMRRSIDDAEDH